MRQAGILILLFMILSGSCRQGSSDSSERPNFIVIYTDDQRFDALGCNGNSRILTPEIDKMATQALIFENAHVTFALCAPSRAAMLTGRYGSNNGVLDLKSPLNAGEKTLPEYLKEQGYTSALVGKWHTHPTPAEVGFNFYSYFWANGTYYGREVINMNDTVYPKYHVDEYGVEQSIAFLEKQTETNEPFFLFHCPQTPHMNGNLIWDAKKETKQRYEVSDMPVAKTRLDNLSGKPEYLKSVRNLKTAKNYGYPDSLAIQKHTRDYYAVITELDGFLGKLFNKIDELDLRKNTYIIFMSDNGWMLGDHGFTSKVLPYEPSTHVPAWIIGPGIKPGKTDAFVSNIDILPTLLDLAGGDIPENVHGKSWKSILKGTEDKFREYFIYEGLGTFGNAKHNLTRIDEDFRYIVTYEDEKLGKVVFNELYNLKDDPFEEDNVVDKKKYKKFIDLFDADIKAFKNMIMKN